MRLSRVQDHYPLCIYTSHKWNQSYRLNKCKEVYVRGIWYVLLLNKASKRWLGCQVSFSASDNNHTTVSHSRYYWLNKRSSYTFYVSQSLFQICLFRERWMWLDILLVKRSLRFYLVWYRCQLLGEQTLIVVFKSHQLFVGVVRVWFHRLGRGFSWIVWLDFLLAQVSFRAGVQANFRVVKNWFSTPVRSSFLQ